MKHTVATLSLSIYMQKVPLLIKQFEQVE